VSEPGRPPLHALAELVGRVAQTLHGGADDAARARTAVDVAELQAIVGRVDHEAASASSPFQAPSVTTPASRSSPAAPGGARDPRGDLPAGLDLAQIADALRVFGDWLRAPTAAGEAEAERVMTDLQLALGPLIGWDPGREDAARRAQYRRGARAALDDIFPVAGKKPDQA